MKATSKLTIAFLALLMSSCAGNGDRVQVRNPADEYHVERLFTVDSATVYRFADNGEYIYFVNRAGSTSWNHSKRQGKVKFTKHNQVETDGE